MQMRRLEGVKIATLLAKDAQGKNPIDAQFVLSITFISIIVKIYLLIFSNKIIFNFIENLCTKECPDGYYGNELTMTCESCHKSCAKCKGKDLD